MASAQIMINVIISCIISWIMLLIRKHEDYFFGQDKNTTNVNIFETNLYEGFLTRKI